MLNDLPKTFQLAKKGPAPVSLKTFRAGRYGWVAHVLFGEHVCYGDEGVCSLFFFFLEFRWRTGYINLFISIQGQLPCEQIAQREILVDCDLIVVVRFHERLKKRTCFLHEFGIHGRFPFWIGFISACFLYQT